MIGDFTWGVIVKDLEGLAKRRGANAQNIANVNTPRYARREVAFEEQLDELINGPKKLPLANTNREHIANIPINLSKVVPSESRVVDERYRLDANNVDPEAELARMTQTGMLYQAMARILSRKVAMYRTSIGGR